MRYEIVVGEKELIAAKELMSASRVGRKVRRIIFIVFAVLFLIFGILGMQSEKISPALASISFGSAALFIWLLISSRPKSSNAASLKIKRDSVTYEFSKEVFISIVGKKKTAVNWNRLKNWGWFREFLYIEFGGNQFVLIDREQLPAEAIKEIEEFLQKKRKRKDVFKYQ